MQQAKINDQPVQGLFCSQCCQLYNFVNRKPTQICTNHHRVCQQCAIINPVCYKCNPGQRIQNATKQMQNLNNFHANIQRENKAESKVNKVSQISQKQQQLRHSEAQISEGIQIRFVLNKTKSNRSEVCLKKNYTRGEIQFVLNKSKSSQRDLSLQPGFKRTNSQLVQKIQLLNLRENQANIPTDRLPGSKQETSIRLHNQSAVPVRYRVQSQAIISQSKSVQDKKNYRNFEKYTDTNQISPLPLKYKRKFQERTQIQKLISVGNSDRNPNLNQFNFSDNMQISEVQQFQGYRLVNINEQTPKKQITLQSKIMERKKQQMDQIPTQRTQGQNFEIRNYLQDKDWLANMREIDEGKEVKYIITFMLQFVFIYFNLHFALRTPKGMCMDSSHGFDFFILRTWLLGSAIADIFLLIITLIVMIFYVSKAMEAQKFQICQRVIELVLIGKMFLWTLALTALMLQSLKGSCSADLLSFGIGSVLIQMIVMVVLLVKKCEQPDEQDQQS